MSAPETVYGNCRESGCDFLGTVWRDHFAGCTEYLRSDLAAAAIEAARAEERERCAEVARIFLENEEGDLGAIAEEYIKAMSTGTHMGRRMDKATAKNHAIAFTERADAVGQMASHVAAAIRKGDAHD